MRAHLAKMSLLFEEADTSGDGRLDLEELSIKQMPHVGRGIFIATWNGLDLLGKSR